jgi:hypothetical protein
MFKIINFVHVFTLKAKYIFLRLKHMNIYPFIFFFYNNNSNKEKNIVIKNICFCTYKNDINVSGSKVILFFIN